MTPAEQFLLESINRARLDPLGEARRFGIDLNQGLAPGTLDGGARQPLAPNAFLNKAAATHSQWMLENDVFSHTGAQGSSAGDRMKEAGYVFEGSWTWGENISWSGSTGTISLDTEIGKQHRGLFLSPGHRVNLLKDTFTEVGVAQEAGRFTSGLTYNASMVTENFARSGDKLFLTGVIYSDDDKDSFYSIGEGVGGTGIRAGTSTTSSASAGGYALGLNPAASLEAGFVRDGLPEIRFKVDLSTANAKVDLVDGTRLESSAHLTLVSGATAATLLGTARLNLTGSDGADRLTGNAGANKISGARGNDTIDGAAGSDSMIGGSGNDTYHVRQKGDVVVELSGGGSDLVCSYLSAYTLPTHVENARIMSTGKASLTGNTLANVLHAGKGDNVLDGGSGTDTLSYAYGANGTSGVKVSLATTTAQATGGSGIDTISGFERLTGSSNGDSLSGNSGTNLIRGGSGKDSVSGGGGADTLYGDAGDDLLRGGTGKDTLYGGSGKDVFRFDTTPDSTTNVDRIMDFSVADDTIQLENAIFTRFGKTATGPIPSSSFKANITGVPSDANDYLVYETDTGELFYDTNGNAAGGATQIALLGVNLSLTAADFVLV